MRRLLGLLLLVALAGCLGQGSYDETIKSLADKYPNEVALSKKYLAELKAHDLADIEQHVDASLRSNALHANLEKLASFFPPGEPIDMKLIGVWRNEILNAPDMSTTRLDYEYDFSGKWYQATIFLKGSASNIAVAGLSVTALVGPLEEITKFTLAGKPLLSYVVLGLACAIPAFMLFAVIVCVRTPMLKRKWLWVLFIVFGVGGWTLNWLEGTVAFSLLAFRLGGAGFASGGPYSPVFLQISVPLGAIVFLLTRRKWLAR